MTDPETIPTPPTEPAPTPAQDTLLDAAKDRHAELHDLLLKAAPAAKSDPLADPDYVHDARVASRRLGEVARLLEPLMDKPSAKAVAASLRSLRQSMGDLRDADVTCEHLTQWRMPAPIKKTAHGLAEQIAAKRPQLADAARAQLASPSVTGTLVLLAQLLEQHNSPDDEKSLHRSLLKQLKRREKQLRRSFGKAALKQSPEALHEARIRIKKLRYLLELLKDAPHYEKTPESQGIKNKLEKLKRLQRLLGDHHDTHVIEQQLTPLAKQTPTNPRTTTTWKKWTRQLHHQQAKRAADFYVQGYIWANANH